ncbi:MAG: PAS domain S-box protein [Gemmatimonadetes bacterium]|nr:PAS domain S-box protein [Gemmatimonadota bacterium]
MKFGWLDSLGAPLPLSYDAWSVFLSIATACLAGFVSLRSIERMRAAKVGPVRRAWSFAGILTLASGIWAMHFTGMLAVRLPVAVAYDATGTLLSMLPAFVGCALGLAVYVNDETDARRRVAAVVLLALGIGGMHFGGLAAVRTTAEMRFQPTLLGLSLVGTVALAWVALRCFDGFGRGESRSYTRLAGIAIGLAISCIHYGAMAAIRFYPGSLSVPPTSTIGPVVIGLLLNTLVGFILLVMLIGTAASRARASARHEAEKFRSLLELAPDGIFVCSSDGMIELANSRAETILGYAPGELLGVSIDEVIPRELRRVHPRLSVAIDGRELAEESTTSSELEIVGKAGQTLPVEISVSRAEVDARAVVMCIIRDVVEQRAREHENRQLAAVVIQTTDAVALMDPDGQMMYVNPAFQRLSGYSNEEAVGQLPDTLQLRDDDDTTAEIWRTLRRGDEWSGPFEFMRKDGAPYPADVSIAPIRDSAGEVTGFVEVRRDRIEEARLNDQLLESQKLEAVGQLAAGIAHEINTPIQFVGDNLRFLGDGMTDLAGVVAQFRGLLRAAGAGELTDAQVAAVADAVEQADLDYLLEEMPTAIAQSLEGADRVAKIVRAMKDYAHPSNEHTAIDVNAAIESTLTVARNEWKYVADVETAFDPDLPAVTCSPGQFNQVMVNMLVNAAHAIEAVVGDGSGGKGQITIGTRSLGDAVEISISDTGCGMSPEVQGRVFEPFFTTKDVGRGTGQGLSIAHSVIVKNHGGSLRVASSPGVGTTFTIQLPLLTGGEEVAA